MGLFTKKEEKSDKETLPELPDLPEFNESNQTTYSPEVKKEESIKNEDIEITPLPKIQESDNRINEIKQALDSEKPQELYKIDEDMEKTNFPPRYTPEVENVRRPIEKKPIYSREPVYIRLDKFETALVSIEEIKNKIIEIERLLEKAKRIQKQEEKELEGWEKELRIIKNKIDSIDRDLFGNIR